MGVDQDGISKRDLLNVLSLPPPKKGGNLNLPE